MSCRCVGSILHDHAHQWLPEKREDRRAEHRKKAQKQKPTMHTKMNKRTKTTSHTHTLNQGPSNDLRVMTDLGWKNSYMRLYGCCDLIFWFSENINISLIVLSCIVTQFACTRNALLCSYCKAEGCESQTTDKTFYFTLHEKWDFHPRKHLKISLNFGS